MNYENSLPFIVERRNSVVARQCRREILRPVRRRPKLFGAGCCIGNFFSYSYVAAIALSRSALGLLVNARYPATQNWFLLKIKTGDKDACGEPRSFYANHFPTNSCTACSVARN